MLMRLVLRAENVDGVIGCADHHNEARQRVSEACRNP